MLPERRGRAGTLLRCLISSALSYHYGLAILSVMIGGILVSPAEAESPFPGPGASDPYAYQNYMFITPAQYPPSDLGGDDWKYFSGNACDLYGQFDVRCSPAINSNPQELHGVTGA
jgi:hypothetical protein